MNESLIEELKRAVARRDETRGLRAEIQERANELKLELREVDGQLSKLNATVEEIQHELVTGSTGLALVDAAARNGHAAPPIGDADEEKQKRRDRDRADARTKSAAAPTQWFEGKPEPEPTEPWNPERVAPPERAPLLVQLEAALHSFEGSKKRWNERRITGLNDQDLQETIGQEFGTGGRLGGQFDYHTSGGKRPKFFLGNTRSSSEGPTLAGAKLVMAVRSLLEIPYPLNERQFTGPEPDSPEAETIDAPETGRKEPLVLSGIAVGAIQGSLGGGYLVRILGKSWATDDELQNAISSCWGGTGLRKHDREGLSYTTRAGATPALFVGTEPVVRRTPELAGAKLLQAVRFVLGIPSTDPGPAPSVAVDPPERADTFVSEPATKPLHCAVPKDELEMELLHALTNAQADATKAPGATLREPNWRPLIDGGAGDADILREIAEIWPEHVLTTVKPDQSGGPRGYSVSSEPVPAIWLGGYRGYQHKPDLAGKALIDLIRRLLEIPTPAAAKRTAAASFRDPIGKPKMAKARGKK